MKRQLITIFAFLLPLLAMAGEGDSTYVFYTPAKGGEVKITQLNKDSFKAEPIAKSGFEFLMWTNKSTVVPYIFARSAEQDDIIGAIFVKKGMDSEGGIVEISMTDSATMAFQLKAVPSSCATFNGWTNSETSTIVNYTIGVDCDVMPKFTVPLKETSLMDCVGGTIDAVHGICQYTLTARPFVGYSFLKWNDDCTTSTRVVPDNGGAYVATFVRGYDIVFVDKHDTTTVIVYANCSINDTPQRPSTDDEIFLGWATSPTDTKPNVTFPYWPTENDSLFAVYRVKPGTIIISTDRTSTSLDLVPEQAPYADVVITNKGVLTIEESSIDQQLIFRSVVVEGGGKLVVPENSFCASNIMILHAGEQDEDNNYFFRYPQLVVNGILNVGKDSIFYDYLLSNKQLYPFSVPVNVTLQDVHYTSGLVATHINDYNAAVYDGGVRAQGLTGWRYLDASKTVLKNGVGYTMYAMPLKTWYNGAYVREAYSRMRFPLYIGPNFTEHEKYVSVTAYPSKTGRDNDAGWNMVANPYFADYTHDVAGFGANSDGIGLLVDDGSGGYEWQGTLRYVVIPSNDGRSYRSELASSTNLPAFKNFFVQIGEGDALLFPISNRRQYSPDRAIVQNGGKDSIILVNLKHGEDVDALGILIGSTYTENYEINADLQKFGHNTGVNVYAWIQERELSYVAINESFARGFVPIGYIAPRTGTYAFAIAENQDISAFKHVYLYDSQVGWTIDLLSQDYTFTTDGGTYNNRFAISLELMSKDNLSTEIPSYQQQDSHRVYDILGREILNETKHLQGIYIVNGRVVVQ